MPQCKGGFETGAQIFWLHHQMSQLTYLHRTEQSEQVIEKDDLSKKCIKQEKVKVCETQRVSE